MSKEEKAVRDALAKVEKDSAVSDAAVAKLNQPAAASSYEEARSKLSEIKDPKIRAAAEKAFAGVDRQTERLTTEAARAGMQVTPTGALAPAQKQLTPQEIAAQIATATAASAAANTAELARQQQAAEAERLRRAGQSGYDILLAEFSQYGLGALVEPLKALIVSGPSSSELTLALRASPAYQDRFAANKERVKKGLAAYNEATYIALEDGYQSVMRNYGLPASFYAKDSTGRQKGFETLLAGDVKVPELEERIILGKNQLLEGPAETKKAFAEFFPNITEGDILGYVLDPEKGLSEIKRKVSAAQIGGAFLGTKTTSGAALTTSLARAEELARYGVTGATAKQAATAIGGGLERGRQLTSFYQESPYTQELAEQELLNLPGQVQATEKRKKIIGLEQAEFGGKTGVTSGALGRDRAGSY